MNLEKSKFYGTDADNETSLLEYGLLVYSDEHEDGSGTHFAVYRIGGNLFGTGHISESDLDNIINGKEWADEKDINSFLSFVGMTREEWLMLPLVMKLSDLISYWGYENIMGTDYSPITEEEAIEKYL
jgi:hypothetical protein